KRFRSMQYSA
nr:Chain B, peptide boronate inhibitor [Drosophila melanogaster]